eukprot:jgi/Pico_ML_1/51880/g12.t1
MAKAATKPISATRGAVRRIEGPPAVRETKLARAICGGATALVVALAVPTVAQAGIRLPPLDSDPNRCERAYVGNTIGQANAVSDKVLDVRECKLSGKNFNQKTLSGALMVDADFSGSTFVEAVLTKVYAKGAKFAGADFTSAVLDRAVFDGADMKGANFYNSVITGSTFIDADLTGASFEDALIGGEDVKRLCSNPTLVEDSRFEVGCRD